MSYISQYIDTINKKSQKAFTAFLTTGFPEKKKFIDTACGILDAGADLFELGIPFSDPVADGPVIQKASHSALTSGINLNDVFESAEKIKSKTNKPVILMGYSNPIYKYGIKNFANRAIDSGVDGLIIPDIPLEEYNSFVNSDLSKLDLILLTTPASADDRISEIDQKSNGFVYCVSVNGTTGGQDIFTPDTIKNIERTYNTIKKNKMLVGFGVSSPKDIKKIKHTCDGVIVASSIMRKMMEENYSIDEVLNFVSELSNACKN